MNSPELKKLIELLDYPDQLKLVIDKSRAFEDLDSAVLGFIAMYDSLCGDCLKMKQQLSQNKAFILSKDHLKKPTSFIKSFLRYAALFVVVVIGGLITVFYSTKEDKLELSTRYIDPGIPTYMSTSSATNWSSIMFSFRKGDYSTVEIQLKESLKFNAENDTLVYYLSVTNFLQDKQGLGKSGFEELSRENGPYAVKSNYYLGLILVNQKKYSQALQIFKKVIKNTEDPVSYFAEKHIKEIEQYLKSK